MSRYISEAGSRFFDHFGILPDADHGDNIDDIIGCFSRIPWENLTKLLVKSQTQEGSGRLRSPRTVVDDYIHHGAGGTCFSLTATLDSILESAGYHCSPVMADMNHGTNIHCGLLIADSRGREFLADPGYLVPSPVPLSRGESTRLSIHGRVLEWEPDPDGNSYCMYSLEKGVRQWRYRVRLSPVSQPEFRKHWERSFDSTGMNSLHLNMLTGDGRISAHNMNLRLVSGTDKRNEKLRNDYTKRIRAYFGLDESLVQSALDEWRKLCQDR